MNFATQTYRTLPNGRVTVKTACTSPGCNNVTASIVSQEQIDQWKAGALVQVAFPEIPNNIREALFVTGMCSPCWDALFPEEECGFCQQTDCDGECDTDYEPYPIEWDYPEYDAQTAFYESTGRMQFPNEY